MALANLVLADMTATSLIWFLVVGLIAGFLASVVVRGSGFGIIGDIIAGIIGAFIGGWLFSQFGISIGGGIIGSIFVAFIGALILIAILRLFSRGRSTRRV